jgi:outer membrane protein assembly factor BamE (lipoprotein component of BamABCDE complex)
MRAIKLIFFSSLIILLGSCSHRLLDKKVFDKVEIGMAIEEVKNILGEPAIIKTYDDSTIAYFYYVHNDAWTKDYASVYFDKAGWVTLTAYKNPS